MGLVGVICDVSGYGDYGYIEGEVMARIVVIGGKAEDWLPKKGKGKNKDERQRLYAQLEDLWPKAVKITYGHFDGNYYYCEISGKPCESGEGTGRGLGIFAHHIEGKQSYNLRWLVINGTPICSTWHTMGRFSAHQDRTMFINKMIEIRGQDWYDELLKIKGEKKKWTIADMKKKKLELKGIIADYKISE